MRHAGGAIVLGGLLVACGSDGGEGTQHFADSATADVCSDSAHGMLLPWGFCATVFADGLGKPRHMTTTPSGDVFVAIDGDSGGVTALRDADHDGVAEEREEFGESGGTGIEYRNGTLYFAENGRILAYDLPDGSLLPKGDPRVIVEGLPDDGDHPAKAIAFDHEGRLVVNIASASNACQKDNRKPGAAGMDPCPELAVRAGLWRFDAQREHQTERDGERIVTGVRNATAIAAQPGKHDIWVAVNGRDQLHEDFPKLYTDADDKRLPGEEIWRVEEGSDHGWPYCYYDMNKRSMMLAPEYGGDGEKTGRCNTMMRPVTAMGAHWAPLGMHFYQGTQFPERYRNGLFIATHGSRFAPDASDSNVPGYNVVFFPWTLGTLGQPEIFARNFAGDERPLPDKAEHRPVGLAEGPDGALFISDDQGGRIWRIRHQD
jgi:glucose/arabinose dehydrogenase